MPPLSACSGTSPRRAPSTAASACASEASLNTVAVPCALTRSTGGGRASSSACWRRARGPGPRGPAPSGGPRRTTRRSRPRSRARAFGAVASSLRTSAITAAPSPSARPSRPARNGRGAPSVQTARNTSKPDATNTLTASKPPHSATSHAPASEPLAREPDRERARRARAEHEGDRLEIARSLRGDRPDRGTSPPASPPPRRPPRRPSRTSASRRSTYRCASPTRLFRQPGSAASSSAAQAARARSSSIVARSRSPASAAPTGVDRVHARAERSRQARCGRAPRRAPPRLGAASPTAPTPSAASPSPSAGRRAERDHRSIRETRS